MLKSNKNTHPNVSNCCNLRNIYDPLTKPFLKHFFFTTEIFGQIDIF